MEVQQAAGAASSSSSVPMATSSTAQTIQTSQIASKKRENIVNLGLVIDLIFTSIYECCF